MPIQAIDLDKNQSDHLYTQVYRQLKSQILDGALQAEEKLPTIRALAEKLQVNTVTVVNAYRCLEEDGLIYKRVGSGSYVAPLGYSREPAPLAGLEEPTEKLSVTVGESAYNFASGTPTADLFPVARFKEVLNDVLDRDQGEAFGYHEAQGYYPLREAIAEMMQRYQMNLSPDHLQIISGAQQGIDIVAKALLKYGDTVLVESPTYAGALATFLSRGVRVESFELTPDGPVMADLQEKIRRLRPKLIYVMPNFHNPTGWSYPAAAQEELLRLAHQNQVYLLEDDYTSELTFSGEPRRTLKSRDRYHNVIYLRSFSKIMMPGLRLGIMTLPPHLHQAILSAKQSTDVSTFGLTQRAFELFIRRGHWDKQVESVQKVFRERYQAFLDGSAEFLTSPLRCHLPDGGIHFWIEVPAAAQEPLIREAAARGVLIVSGDHFYLKSPEHKHVRLSIASLGPEQIRQGLFQFRDACNAVLAGYRPPAPREFRTPIL